MIVQSRGCKIVEYRMACEDMARWGWSKRADERSVRLAGEVRLMGGWPSPEEKAAQIRLMDVPF